MEKKYTITEKQLAFLDSFLDRKGYTNNETKFELMDHLICDFEENGNGNLSQFLSNKLYFIEQQKFKKEKIFNRLYFKEMLKEFVSFFIDFKKITITILLFFLSYLTTVFFSEKVVLIVFAISLVSIQLYGLYTCFVEKELRKLEEFRALAAAVYLPSIVVHFFPLFKGLLNYKIAFSIFWALVFILMLSFSVYTKRKKDELVNKYKYLIKK